MENSAYTGKERTACKRHEIEIFVDLNWGDKQFTYESVKNVGRDGMFIQTEYVFHPGSMLTLRFPLPHSDWIFEIDTEVVWTRSDSIEKNTPLSEIGCAVVFKTVNKVDAEKLDEFFTKLPDLNLDFMKMLIDENR